MFGTHVRVLSEASRLIVTEPFNIWVLIFTVPFCLWFLYAIFTQGKRSAFYRWLVIFVIGFGIFPRYAVLTLDRQSQTATLRRYEFFYIQSMDFPLDTLDHAYLHTGSTTARIVLQYSDGHVLSLSSSDQMDGKPEAVFAINNFLGVSTNQ